jgi:HSP20 family protein
MKSRAGITEKLFCRRFDMNTITRSYRNGGSGLDLLQREFDHAVNRLFYGGGGSDSGTFAPYAVDVREDADHVYVEAELPGFKKDDVQITLENSTLTISAERHESHEAPKNAGKQDEEDRSQWLLNERRYSRFLRSFTLPPTVDERSVEAKLNEGVLTITLKKREETKPRKINVT